MNPLIERIVTAAFVAIAVGIWLKAGRRLLAGLPLVEPSARRPVPWRGVDVLLIILALVVVQSFVGLAANSLGFELYTSAARADRQPQQTENSDETSGDAPQLTTAGVVANMLASLLTLGLTLGYLRVVNRASWRDLGFDSRFVLSDLRLGARSFFGLAPLVYGMQAFLTQWFPSHHPLIKFVDKESGVGTLVLAMATAVAVAPLFEEFIFRVLFQGWMEAAIWRRLGARLPHTLLPERPATNESALVTEQPPADAVVVESSIASNPSATAENPYSSPRSVASHDSADVSSPASLVAQPILPLVISALLFALMHLNHGPDAVALFVLALGLGYLYRQTHRILPSLTVHLLLNGCTMVAIIFKLAE